MSDSDDCLSNNVFMFRGTTKIHAKGPNINTNISGLSFRNNNNNIMTSTLMNLPRNRHEDTVYDQRNMYRRDVSPMSVRSVSGMPAGGMLQVPATQYRGSQSVYNGRAESPTTSMGSVRTADSNISAFDITNAIKTKNFSKYDLMMIKDALKKYEKGKTRRRVEKRRNARKFLKGGWRVSGGESGDMASDSSASSNDNRSSRSYKTMQSVRSDFTDIRKVRRANSNIYRDRAESFRQNFNLCPPRSTLEHGLTHTHRLNNSSMMPLQNRHASSSTFELQRDRINSSIMTQKDRFQSGCNNSTTTLKERFQNGFQLPCQRFHQSISSIRRPLELQSVDELCTLTARSGDHLNERRISHNSATEPEDLFSEKPDEQISRASKRSLDDIDVIHQPSKKKSKISPSPKAMTKLKPPTPKKTLPAFDVGKQSPFVFVKPQFPVRRLAKAKNVSKKPSKPLPQEHTAKSPKQIITKQPQKSNSTKKTSNQRDMVPSTSSQLPDEVLISKSTQPLDHCLASQSEPVTNNETEQAMECDQSEPQNTTDFSMRPSFIKRKLFSQKVDVPDKNSSSESVQADSPGTTIYGKIQKEKNRTRKIVASQSLMSRDVTVNESNLLDLIYKIVPQDRMNATSVNRSETHTNKSNKVAPSDPAQWDVSNVVAGDAGHESDTFTDEEIFNETVVSGTQKPKQAADVTSEIHSTKKTDALSKQTSSTKPVSYAARPLEPGKPKASDKNHGQMTGQPAKDSKETGKKAHTLTQAAAKPNVKDKMKEASKPVNVPNRMQTQSNQQTSPGETTAFRGFNVHKCVKTFWDTDFESEPEPEKHATQNLPGSRKVDETMASNMAQTANQAVEVNYKDKSNVSMTWSQRLLNKLPRVSVAVSSMVSKSKSRFADEIVSEDNDIDIPLTKRSETKPSKKVNLPEKIKIQTEKGNSGKLSEKENTKPNNSVTETSRKNEKNVPLQKNKPDNDIISQKNAKNHRIAPQKNIVANKSKKFDNNTKNKVSQVKRLRSEQVKNDQSMYESAIYSISLRSRKIDLSLNSTSTPKKVERLLPKKSTAKTATNKKETKLEELQSNEVSRLSDMSFTLKTDHTPQYKKSSGRTRTGVGPSTSFALQPKAAPIAPTRRNPKSRSNIVSREVSLLLNASTTSMTTRKRISVPPKRYIMY